MIKKISLLLIICWLNALNISANDIRGDVNGDGIVDMQDVMFIVNYILNGKFPDEGGTSQEQLLFSGDNRVDVAGQEYHATILYQVLKNDDNTIDVIVPEYVLEATIMGDLTIGKYTIKNIPYDATKGSYYKEYADGTLSIHIKSVPAYGTGMDDDYIFNNKQITTSIEVKTDGTNAAIVNNYSIGGMPFPIETSFTGISEKK